MSKSSMTPVVEWEFSGWLRDTELPWPKVSLAGTCGCTTSADMPTEMPNTGANSLT